MEKQKISREKIKVDKNILRDIIYGDKNENFKLVEDKITNSDPEDGGADHLLIIQRKSDSKYFRTYYSDWDMDYNFERDFPEDLSEVFPEQVTITVFK